MIPSYPKVYNFGHRVIRDLFEDSVLIQEKLDGSQISFGILDGELRVRSKGKHLILDNPEKLFSNGVLAIKEREHLLTPGFIYRGEYLQKPKHNVLAYERVPKGHIALYDVETSPSNYVSGDKIAQAAKDIDLEAVPWYHYGGVDFDQINLFLEMESFLGGPNVEGVVAKSHTLFSRDGKALMGKHVSEQFREKSGRRENKARFRDGHGDILLQLGETYRTEARWTKAAQRMREAGELKECPSDIGQLIKVVQEDVMDECFEEIQDALLKWAWKHISRKIIAGLPEWYKAQLLEKQFENDSYKVTQKGS